MHIVCVGVDCLSVTLDCLVGVDCPSVDVDCPSVDVDCPVDCLNAIPIICLSSLSTISSLKLVKEHRPAPLYLTDEAIHNMEHTVLRLPVAHCELNPIELAWASVKGYVAEQNRDYTLAEVERLTPEGFKHTTEMWRHFCRHVVDVENDYFAKDGIVEDAVEEMIIAVGGDEDDSDEEVQEEECLLYVDLTVLYVMFIQPFPNVVFSVITCGWFVLLF